MAARLDMGGAVLPAGLFNNDIGQLLQFSEASPMHYNNPSGLLNFDQQAISQYQANNYLYNYAHLDPTKLVPPNKISDKSTKKGTNMFSEVAQDMKVFVKEHKSLIYWVAVLFIFDHFFFQGAFKSKLKNIMDNLVGKVESKLQETKV